MPRTEGDGDALLPDCPLRALRPPLTANVAQKTYRAEVDRDGKFWRIRVPEIQRTTQARSEAGIEPMARDLISIMEDIPADSFSLEIVPRVP